MSGDVLDVPVAQHHLYREAPHQALQVGHTGQRGLPRGHEEQLPIEVLGQGLRDLLHLESLLHVVSDELLNFVQHHQGQGELAVHRQGIRDGGGHLLAGDVGDLRELLLQELASIGLGVGQARPRLQQGFGEVAGHVHVRKLLRQRAPGRLQLRLHRGQDAFPRHPQDKLRLVVLLGQPFRLEHDAQQRQTNLVSSTSPKLASGGVQGAVAPTLHAEFLEVLEDAGGELGKAAGRGTVGELIVGPERAQHLGQVRLAAAEEAGNPDPRLLGPRIQIQQELVQDGFQALLVLSVADEGFQFVAQDGLGGIGVVFRYFSHAVVDEAVLLGGLVVDVPVQHGGLGGEMFGGRRSVFGQQRDGQVVPAVARVEEAVGVILWMMLTREEH